MNLARYTCTSILKIKELVSIQLKTRWHSNECSSSIDSRGARSAPGLETTVISHLHADPDFAAYYWSSILHRLRV